jgi:cell shape-determining protein MreC
MSIEDKIKRWVVLDNQVKQLTSQIQLLKDEKEELTNHLIEHFDNANKKYPIINISDGKLNFIQVKQPNGLSYKFLDQCFIEYFSKNANGANANSANANVKSLLDYIKSKRTYTISKIIKRVYN